jgi:hypothetical protein
VYSQHIPEHPSKCLSTSNIHSSECIPTTSQQVGYVEIADGSIAGALYNARLMYDLQLRLQKLITNSQQIDIHNISFCGYPNPAMGVCFRNHPKAPRKQQPKQQLEAISSSNSTHTNLDTSSGSYTGSSNSTHTNLDTSSGSYTGSSNSTHTNLDTSSGSYTGSSNWKLSAAAAAATSSYRHQQQLLEATNISNAMCKDYSASQARVTVVCISYLLRPCKFRIMHKQSNSTTQDLQAQ